MHMVKDQLYAYMCIYMHILEFLQIEMVKQNLYPLPALWPAACARLRRLPLIRKSRPGRPWGPLWPTSSNFDGENDERQDFWVAQCFLIIPDDLACGWRSLELGMHQGKKALALAQPGVHDASRGR